MMKLLMIPAIVVFVSVSSGCGHQDIPVEDLAGEVVVMKTGPDKEAGIAEASGPDRHFRKWGETFFSRAVDWRWFKAQGMAESNLRPHALSPAGARGLMQLMPGTSKEMAARLKIPDRPYDLEHSIMMGIAYDRLLWDKWTAPRSERERLRMTFASYNAGLGNILKAQRMARGECEPGSWNCVALWLNLVVGDKAEETIGYVIRIEAIYSGLME